MTRIQPRGSPDDQFINIDDTDEVLHWSALLQLTPAELREAVAAVGPDSAKVKARLQGASGPAAS